MPSGCMPFLSLSVAPAPCHGSVEHAGEAKSEGKPAAVRVGPELETVLAGPCIKGAVRPK
jgi:hypothetical protein